ncbi:hypothetical protein Btru_028795, partial [Bulinus truncatus]
NNFRHPLARSHSLPDSYNMQIGTPRPQMDPSLSHSVGDVGPDAMYRNVRMPMQMSEHQRPLESALRRNKLLPRSPWAFPFMLNYPDGSENPGGIPHQQLRVILGQQTKQRMAKKQEEAERMMTGPPSGWHDGSEGLDVFPTRPPFRGPSPQGFVRGPHSGMPPQVTRPPFYPGFMQPRPPMAEPFGNAPQEALLTDQRSPYLHMMQDRIAETNSGPSSLPTPQHVNIVPYSASQQPPMPPPTNMPSSAVSDSHTNLTRHLSGGHQAGEDEIFSGTSSPQATAAKVNVQGDGSSVEADTLLEGIGEKSAKPSLSSEEDKNEDDDLLSADGTFDILKYTDPDLDLDLDDKMFEHLDFIDESHTGDAKKSDDEKAFDLKDESKDEKDHDGVKSRSSTAPDFQAQFLEFNQRHKLEAKSESDVKAAKIAEEKEKEKTEVGQIAAMLQGTEALASTSLQDIKPSGLDPSTMGLNRPAAFLQNLASPHMQMSPSQGQGQPGSSGLPSPKIMQSPRSGQPSPRTPGIQSPFNALLSGRHSASPHSQPMTPAGPQLSPFSASNAQNPFSPPASAGGQGYGQGPGSAPHSPYPTTAQPPFGNLSSPGPPHMMSPGYPPSAMGPRGPGGYNQMGHSGGPRMPPMYSHGIRGHDGQPGRFPRPGEGGLEGIEGLGPRMPQPMSMQDGRPHPMYQSMQQRGMRVPPPLSNHPGMPQMGMPQSRHQFPGQPPRLSHPPQVRGMGPRQPGPPFQGGPPGGPQNQAPSTLLDELLEQEKEEQKRQAEQQAMMHRRDVSGEQGMHSMSPSMSSMSPGIPNISAGMPPVSGVGPSTHNMGGMPMRMDHPGMRMTGPADASGVWNTPPESSQFQQGFPPRLMHPGMPQRSPAPFPGPPDIRVPGPSGAGPPPGQQMAIGPPTPVSPPTGDMGPEYERQAAQYEDYLNKQTLYLEGQVKTFEGQVNKLKRSKKTIQARQRLAKKNNQELNPVDTNELERISTEQSGLQKQLEAQRKLLRQHQHLIQDYKTKQQEQFGRMWTGGMADTPMSNPALPISHPRTPGGHNSVRLSPTARQEYEAYMHNRIRMATQQQQQQNRMRPPTTIIGDNNPFSEAFQQREQIRRAPMTPGPPGAPSVSATPAMPLSPMPPPPGSGSQPLRPPFNIGVTNDSAASPTASSTTGSLTPTSLAASPTTPLNTVVAVSTASGAPVGPPPSPMGQSQITTGPPTLTSAPQGQSLTNPTGPVTTGPRGQLDGMGAMQFYRERNIPFDGSGGPRFPRPPGPQVPPVYSESSSSTGPRLPPYPGNPPMFPQATGIEPSRLPFQQAMAFQQGPMQPSQITDVNSANSTGQKEKKKRKKKKKSDEAEGTQSQPLPPTLPSQVIMGQMSGQVPSSSSMNQVPPVKPAELPKPQSETDRRILEILNNSQKELQNPSSPSSARGGKSPRSRSPARAPPVHILEADKSITSLSSGLPLGGSQTSESQPPSSNSNSDTFAVDKQRLQTDPKNPSPGGFLGVDSQTPTGSQPTIPSQSLPPHLQRMPMHPHGGGPPMPPTLSNQQHIQHLQNLARMQHFQQQQFTAMSEGPRHSMDSAQIPPMGGPRYSQVHPYPQRQRYPPGVTPPPMPYQNRLPPQIRTGHPQYPPHLAGVPPRVPIDPRMQGPDGHMIPQHNMMQQRMPASPGLSHLPPGTVTHQGQHLQQINQAPPLTHMPPISSVNQYPGTSHMQGIINMAASNSALTSSTALVGTSQAPSHESSLQPTIPPVSVNSTLSSLSASSGSSINSISTSSVSSLSSASVSSVTSEPQTTSPSHIPADANNQSQNSSSIQQTVAANSALSIPASELASTSKVPTVENQNDNVKKMCDDGIHCGTDDEEEKNEMKRKKACSDGINCGTDDEDERTYSIKKKKICDDGIHCGTDDEEDSAQKKKVCDDGIHCGTDDEEDRAQKKKVCDDGIHCGTDDEEDVAQKKKICEDGIHCGTDDEEDVAQKKKVCDDGIHCGTDDEEDSAQKKKVCDDGIHCGTDDEEDVAQKKKVCDDGIHCGTDNEEDVAQKKKVCDDGIHCGTDDEEDVAQKKKVCDDGIHCGTDDEEDVAQKKKVCDDGIHCGTDDEDDVAQKKKVCDDGIHCGTDDEEDSAQKKKVCDDGIHCGTDDEEDSAQKKKVCDDGIHCGTDDEDDVAQKKKVCDDGIHCGTDDEEDSAQKKKVCDDGIHCGTDDEEDVAQKKKICSDGIHCGTDDEEDVAQKKKVCDDGIHCGTDDEEDVAQKKKICSDGIHCGTDDEDEKDVPPILTHNLENFEEPSKKLSDSSKLLDLPETKHSQSSDTLTDLMDSSDSKVDTFDHIQASMSVPLTPEKPAGTVVVTMLSPIDSEVSSKLAAVSQSLANFKPRIDSDESSEVSIRPSETLTALSFTLPSTVSSSNLSEPFSCTQGLLSSVNKTDHVDQISGLPIEQKVEVDLNTDNCSIESDVNVFEMTKVGNNDPPVYTSASQVIVSLSDTVRSNVRNPSSSPSSVLMITPLNSDQEQLPAPMSVTLSTSSEPPLTPVSLPSTFSSTLSSSASPVSKAHIVSSSQHSKSSSSSSVNLESSATISPSSGSRNSDNRPVIPPLRIRMDGQSQPQVCESPSMPRDGHRSEFSAVSGRSKTEGDLKLILRKSSDGTAELISGPFKDKSKRSRSDQEAKSTSASVHSPLSGATITSTATPSAVYSVKTLDLNSTPPTVSSHQTTSQLTPTSASSCASTSAVTITEPFSSKPGSNLFKNVTYTKSPDNDIVKINVGSSKVTGEGTKKVIRSYTTDVQALERLQSTIDAVASGESSYEPDFDSEPPSGPSSHDSHGNSTPRPPSTSSVSTAISTSTESGMVTASNLHSSVAPGGSLGQGMSPQHNVQFPSAGKGSTQQQRPQVPPQQTLPPQSAQSQQLQQQHAQPLQHPPSGQHSLPGQHPQTGLQQQQQQQHPMQMHHPPQQQSSNYMAHSQTGFNTHPGYHPSRITRPPLDLLQQVSQSALSSAGTAIPTSTGHQVQQEQRSPFMTERSPSAEHSPLHTSPHQSYTDFSSFPGMMGSRPMGSSPGVSPKTPAVQTSQAYMPISGPPQQQFMQGGRFPSRMHEMPAAPPYGMTQHPMSPTGSSMHRQRPPHFGMVGDMNRMARPPRNMSHPQHRPMPPDMMSPDHPGMRPRMASHQFMSPTHPGMQDMPPSPHGMTHTMSGMQPSPHPMHSSTHPMQSSHVMQQNSAHNMPRPQMMGQHHPVMQGPPSPYSQNPMGGNGGPLASLANFHPPGHPGINTSMGSPMPGPHHRPPHMFNPMIGDARMANQLRMMAAAGESNHMQPHYRHMMMRGMTSSTPPSQMSPHLSPQMSPNMQTQPLRHLDTLPDDKNFVPNLLSGGSVGIPGLGNDHMMNMGGRFVAFLF